MDSASEYYKKLYSSKLKVEQSDSLRHFLENSNIPHDYSKRKDKAVRNVLEQAIITLIDKKGRDRMFLDNRRPISLIDVDSKIATKVIANRMKIFLPSVIHANQSGLMKGRFMGETARSVLDIIAHTESLQLPGVLLFIDFEKAFDSIEHEFLYKALECFNFGPSFIKWIQTFYNNLSSCVLNNGFFSSPFQLERGVRQGDPLSPYLFLIAIIDF